MPSPATFGKTGQRLTADAYNMVVSGANAALKASGGHHTAVTIDKDGITIGEADRGFRFDEPSFLCDAVNVGAADLGFLAVAQLTQPVWLQSPIVNYGQPYDADSALAARSLEIEEPTDSGFGRFAVCAEPIAAGDHGAVWFAGVCLAYLVRSQVTLARYLEQGPDRADTRAGQTYLELCAVGAAQVLWVDHADDVGSGFTGPNLAVIRMDHRNTNGVSYTKQGSPGTRGVIETLVFDGSVVLGNPYPGIVSIT